MGSINATSFIFGFVIFTIILLGGGLFITQAFFDYDITEDHLLTDNRTNITGLKKELTNLGADIEDAQDSSNPTSDQDKEWTAVGKVIKKIEAVKAIRVIGVETLKKSLDFVPNFIWWGFTVIISLLIVLLIVRLWIKIDP